MSHKVVSWWKYNPILQKPTSLDPVKPWSWYWYYGPDPASGTSYGQYHDEDHDFDMLSEKKNVVYSPATGKPMKLVAEISLDEVKEHFSKVKSDTGFFEACCHSCKSELISDYPIQDVDEIYCCCCGEAAMETMTTLQNTEKKTMRNAQDVKSQIRSKILSKRRAEAKAIKAEEEAKKEDEDELISLDTIMQAMEEEAAKEQEEGACLEDCEKEEVEKEDEALLGEEVEMEIMADEEEEEEEEKEEKEEEPKEDEEEYLDLDMVLSMINKKQKMIKAKAKKVKAEEAAEKEIEKDKFDDAELADDEEKEEEVKEVKEEVKVGEETGKEPNMVSEENPKPLVPVEMDAMKFEPLASIENLSEVRKEDIDMALYGEDSDNPVWNVTVAGIPTARIQLKKQAHSEEIRSVFCSDDYARDLMVHCDKSGFVPTMNKVKADFWSNYTSNRQIAARFHTEAQSSFEQERKKLLATFKQDFRTCMNIVSAGMSKNFYPDMGNPLKEHMFTNLRTVGLPEQTAISCVEKSFAEGAAPYFDALFEKAEEYMNLTPDARKEIAAAISHGSTIEHKVGSELEEASLSLSDRVAKASVIASMTNSHSPLVVNRELSMDTNEYKAQLKSVWRKQ